MNCQENTTDFDEFLANITLLVAKTTVAIYLVKQTPPNISCYDFVKFLQQQYKRREQQKEAILNFCLLRESRSTNRNYYDNHMTNNNIKITEISNYMILNSSRIKLTKFNLQNVLTLTSNQGVYQLKYSLQEIMSSSINILVHAFKKSSKEGLICTKKMNYFIDMKEDAQSTFRIWLSKTMEYLKQNSNDFIHCFTLLKYFMLPDLICYEVDNNLWYSLTLELALILSSLLSSQLNTNCRSGIIQFITEFINDTLNIFNENIQGLIKQKGKILYLHTSRCAQLIWLASNLLKYFDTEMFSKRQAIKWIRIIDNFFAIYQPNENDEMMMMKLPVIINQLTTLMFITFVLKNKIIKLTFKLE